MLIPYSYSLNQEEPGQWIISFDSGSHFIVNTKVVNLVGILKQSADMPAAFSTYSEHQDFEGNSYSEFEALANNLIDRLKLAANKQYKAQHAYVKLKLPLIPAARIKYVTAPFLKLFSYKLFFTLLTCSLAFNLFTLIQTDTTGFSNYITTNPLLVIGLIFLSTLFHEVGHLAACRYYGAKHGEMGFGFYFIFPVAYSDVTGIWALPKSQRVLVNLAGIYLELLYISLLLALSPSYPDLVFPAAILMTRIAYTMVPFLRNDGYWLTSDLLKEPNLLPRSHRVLNDSLRKCKTEGLSGLAKLSNIV